MTSEKRDVLLAAIRLTHEKNVTIELDTLKEILTELRRISKLDKTTKDTLREASLDEWLMYFEDTKLKEIQKDSPEAKSIENDIFDRYKKFNWLKSRCDDLGQYLGARFTELELPINEKQKTGAALAFLNANEEPKQVWVVPPSQGKSRIQTFLATAALLKTT